MPAVGSVAGAGASNDACGQSSGNAVNRLLDWMNRLAGDRGIIAYSEEERDGELWVVVHCRNQLAADSLFDHLWDQGWRTLGRHGRTSLWVERSEDPTRLDGPAPLDFSGLDDLVG